MQAETTRNSDPNPTLTDNLFRIVKEKIKGNVASNTVTAFTTP